MDDNTKIQALMIYFRHWGEGEIRARKNIQGIRKTEAALQEYFRDLHTLSNMDMSNASFWTYMTEALLPNMNHYIPYDDLGSLKILYHRARFADDIGATFFNAHLTNADEDMMRRINAIIAFPVLSMSISSSIIL